MNYSYVFEHMPKCDKTRYWRMNNETLVNEYKALQKAVFCRMFGHNASQAQSFVGLELQKRGISTIPNLLGPIPVKTTPFK
jgi:hypothetical protein